MSKDEFQLIVSKTVDFLELSFQEAANIFKVSVPTMERWYRGESAPHPLGRDPAGALCIRLLEEYIKNRMSEVD